MPTLNEELRTATLFVGDANVMHDAGLFIGRNLANAPTTPSVYKYEVVKAVHPLTGVALVHQTAMGLDNGNVWYRTNTGGTWSEWVQGISNSEGNQGAQGPQGVQGPAGEDGEPGAQGPAGPQGIEGPEGPAGPQGIQGIQGIQGPDGPQGDEGPAGPQGIQGIQGVQGIQGIEGPEGPEGPIGPTGLIGTWRHIWQDDTLYSVNDFVQFAGSSYITILEHTSDITESRPGTGLEWETYWDLVASKGDTGEAGEQGEDGEIGPQGPPGEDGASGMLGVYRGNWDSGTEYFVNDIVNRSALGENSSFICVLQHVAAAGTNGPITGSTYQTFWDFVARGFTGPQGEQGETGDDGPTGATGDTGAQGDPGPSYFIIAASDEVTAIASTGTKVKFRMPYAFTLTGVKATLGAACATGTFTVDINENGNSILSTKLTFDATEKTTVTAAVPAVISDTALAADAEISIDVDNVGNSLATGLKVTLLGTV